MKRFLVATDISNNSTAALQFALQAASRGEVTLTFLNVHNVMRPTSWPQSQYVAYEQRELADVQQRLEQFVETTRQRLAVTVAEQPCVVVNSVSVENAIMDYAEEHQFDYICIGARGAGAFEKLTGTTTATLINKSAVPVITVPAGYTASPIKQVLYASDLTNLEPEINQVVDVARRLGAAVDLVHIMGPTRPVFDLAILKTTIRQFTDYNVRVCVEDAILEQNLAANLEQVIQRVQPSLLIMFTTERSRFLERLFSPSHSAEYAFIGSVPLLVFTKT